MIPTEVTYGIFSKRQTSTSSFESIYLYEPCLLVLDHSRIYFLARVCLFDNLISFFCLLLSYKKNVGIDLGKSHKYGAKTNVLPGTNKKKEYVENFFKSTDTR